MTGKQSLCIRPAGSISYLRKGKSSHRLSGYNKLKVVLRINMLTRKPMNLFCKRGLEIYSELNLWQSKSHRLWIWDIYHTG